MSGTWRIALMQAAIVDGEREANLEHVETLLDEAARGGAALAVLPEALPLGWTDPSAARLTDAVPAGPTP